MTNGPFHWGNGPKPYGKVKRAKAKRKSSGKGCAVLAFLVITSPVAAGYSIWELFT